MLNRFQTIFKTIAEACGGKYKPFNQRKGLKANWRSMPSGLEAQEGVCSGLSLCFLEQCKKGTDNKFINDKSCQTNPALFLKADLLAQYGADGGGGPGGLYTAAQFAGLKVTDIKLQASLLSALNRTVSAPSGLNMVVIDRHALAVSVQRDTKITMFDPNFGFARFSKDVSYAQFMRHLFLSPVYMGIPMAYTAWVE